jgi:hypothetical protein
MRIIKLSRGDPVMRTREAAVRYFTEELWRKSRFGKFGLSSAKARMKGIVNGTLLLFSYDTECVFLARAAGSIKETRDRRFPFYLPIDMGSIVHVSGSLKDYERELKRRQLVAKNLVKGRAWPALPPECGTFTERYFDYQSLQRYIFVRIGWMQHYRGSLPGDERPIGGGGYNRDEMGHEICNFLPLAGSLYGYYQPQMRADQTFLERIDPAARDHNALGGTTVVWIATRPSIGQVIVGWYRNAKIYRKLGPKIKGRPRGFEEYRCAARASRCVLLPVSARRFAIPRNKGGFGQANICYPLDSGGRRKNAQWMLRAMHYLHAYDGGNVVADPADAALDIVIGELEAARDGRTGQGFAGNALDRRAIEDHGMKRATLHFEKTGYEVENVSRRKSYDLRCTKGSVELHVEVKATTTAGTSVFLTRREAELAANLIGNRALFILHSIRLRGGIASGGEIILHQPWRLNWKDTMPTIYSYRPPMLTRSR